MGYKWKSPPWEDQIRTVVLPEGVGYFSGSGEETPLSKRPPKGSRGKLIYQDLSFDSYQEMIYLLRLLELSKRSPEIKILDFHSRQKIYLPGVPEKDGYLFSYTPDAIVKYNGVILWVDFKGKTSLITEGSALRMRLCEKILKIQVVIATAEALKKRVRV